jgi:hypothetical protein
LLLTLLGGFQAWIQSGPASVFRRRKRSRFGRVDPDFRGTLRRLWQASREAFRVRVISRGQHRRPGRDSLLGQPVVFILQRGPVPGRGQTNPSGERDPLRDFRLAFAVEKRR